MKDAAFITSQDPRWLDVLCRANHDVYHQPRYSELFAQQCGGTAEAFWARLGHTTILMPLIVRSVSSAICGTMKSFDAASPYGYSSPLLIGPENELKKASNFFFNSLQELSNARRLVSVFIRLHPLLEIPLHITGVGGRLVEHGETVYVPLTGAIHDLFSEISRGHRWGIRRLKRLGFTAEMTNSSSRNFAAMYQSTMSRVGASEFYHFSPGFFDSFVSHLPDHTHFCSVHAPDGEITAGGLVTECNGIAQLHFAASDDKYREYAPGKLCIAHIMEWAHSRGNQMLHLGGGVACQGDSLFKFKSGFSGRRAVYRTWRLITNESEYQMLSKGTTKQQAKISNNDYFPIYRQQRTA